MFLLNGKAITPGTPFTHNDIQYPGDWVQRASAKDREALGVEERPDPVRPDDRFYLVSWDAERLDYVSTPKDLDALKEEWTTNVRRMENDILSTTDWLVTRKAETGAPLPAVWDEFRNAVRAKAESLKNDIEAAADFDAFVSLVTGIAWPAAPSERPSSDQTVVVKQISRRQFYQHYAAEFPEDLTQEEALAVVSNGTIPPLFERAVVQAAATEEDKFEIRMYLAGADVIERNHRLMDFIGGRLGMAKAEWDLFFIGASKL